MRLPCAALLVLVVAASPPASAQFVPVYAAIDGIPGSVEIAGREGTVELRSVEHALTSHQLQGPGSAPLSASGVGHSPLVFGKLIDLSTVPLIRALHAGTRIGEIEFSFYTIDDTGTEVEYYTVTLEGAVVTSYDIGYSTAEDDFDGPMEKFGVVYSAVTFTWADGNIETRHEVTTNRTRNAAALAAITADLAGDAVDVSWAMDAQDGVSGFELQRRTAAGYERAAYVPAAGWTDEPRAYSARVGDLDRGLHVFRVAALAVDGQVVHTEDVRVAVGVDDGPLAVGAPYPNPSAGRAVLPVSVDRERAVRVVAYDVLGRTAAVFFDGPMAPGRTAIVPLEGRGLASGTYVVRVESEGETVSRTVRLAR